MYADSGRTPPASLPGLPAALTLQRGGRDPGTARQGNVRLGLPLRARGARGRLRHGRVVGRAGRGRRARLPRDPRRVPGPDPSRRAAGRGAGVPRPAPVDPRRAVQRPDRGRPPQPAARGGAGGRELHRLLPGAGADPRPGVVAGGEGHLLPPRALARADGVGGPRGDGRPAPGEPGLAGAARDDPPRGVERAARARRERDAVQEPGPARHPDRGRRARAGPRRGGRAAARDPAQEPGGALALPPHGGRGGPAGVPQGSASGTPRRGSASRTTSPRSPISAPSASSTTRGPTGCGDRTCRCSCRTSPS